MLKELEDSDWMEAFCDPGASNSGFNAPEPAMPKQKISLASFCRNDVVEISGMCEGVPDEESWIIYGRLVDGRWFYLEAGCDYTGWD
jgi:hypothetical protein